MNIKQAKKEVMNTVRAYLTKDETGSYAIPVERQRPVLLMGPPGIGKTAIMEQIAQEMGIGLVSYTITHHTRQSAIGLPKIAERSFEGTEYSVTEYTMSEIIAAIYAKIEETGIHEGILFLDEINCVSETLAPTMLQFLQYKTFGSHHVPDGFVIVTAGNPPQYNKSVRDFDVVTLDRLKEIDIDIDFDAFREYGYKAGIHGAILAYLEIKKENFYSIKADLEKKKFVTARGWEDLSQIIYVYEKLGIKVDATLTRQYLQDDDIAEDFATYYELYHRYQDIYHIPDILTGQFDDKIDAFLKASFDERLSIIGLMTDALGSEFKSYARDELVQKNIQKALGEFKTYLKGAGSDLDTAKACEQLMNMGKDSEAAINAGVKAGTISREDEKAGKLAMQKLSALVDELKLGDAKIRDLASDGGMAKAIFTFTKNWFAEREQKRSADSKEVGEHLTNCLKFTDRVFGQNQEMVIFLTQLSSGFYSLKFVNDTGNETYLEYNRLLLLKDQKQELRDLILSL